MTVAGREGRRILVLTPFPPNEDGLHGGARLMAQFLFALAERNRVAVLALRTDGEPPTGTVLRERCELVEEVRRIAAPPTVARRLARRIRLARDLIRGIPQWPSDWASAAYGARVRALAADWRAHVIQIEFQVMAQHAPPRAICPAPRVLAVHEPGVVPAWERARARRGPGRWTALTQARAWERFERRALADVDAAVVFTERDRASIEALGAPAPIARISPGITLPAHPLDAAGVAPSRLVFVGSFIHPPNVDAALRLACGILPLVRARHPAAVLDLVGADPPADVRHQASLHVAVTGTVPDVAPYLDRAAVVVVPVRFGGGIRVKVIETLAAGKALVASRLAVEGLDVVDGEHVLLAETDEEFAGQISRLLRDRGARTALAARGREWARAHRGWDRCVAAYEALYDSLIIDAGAVHRHGGPVNSRPWTRQPG